MPTQDSDDDFDVDAEIAKELAALHNEPSSLLQASAQTPAAEQSAVPDVQDSDGSDEEPESLKALRAALAAREQFAQKLTTTLEEIRVLEAPPLQHSDAAANSQDVAEAVAAFCLLSGSCCLIESGDGTQQSADASADHSTTKQDADPRNEHAEAAQLLQGPVSTEAAADAAANAELTGSVSELCQAPASYDSKQQQPSSKWRETFLPTQTAWLAAVDNVASFTAVACEQGIPSAADTEHATADDVSHVNNSRCTQQLPTAAPCTTGVQQANDTLGCAAAAAAARIAAERAAAEEAQRQLWAQQAALQKLLQEQAAAAAAREAASQALRQQLEQQRIQSAVRYMSAWRIARAWQAYRHSLARAARHAAVVALQAAVRGVAARRVLGKLKQQREILTELQEALQSGQQEALSVAQQRAIEAGCGSDADQLVAATQAAQSAAAQHLQQAATAGNHAAFTAAITTAENFAGLQDHVITARQRFESRKVAAEQALHAAVKALPLPQVQCAVDVALQLGVDAKQLANAIETARARDAAAAAKLNAAVRAAAAVVQCCLTVAGCSTLTAGSATVAEPVQRPGETEQHFSEQDYAAAVATCQQLGKTTEAAAAKKAVQQHRQVAAAQLQHVSEDCSNAADIQEVIGLCKSLGGLEQQMKKAAARLQQRQDELVAHTQQHLQQLAASDGSPAPVDGANAIQEQLQQLLQQAELLGVQQETIVAARQQLQALRTAVVQELQQAAAAGSIQQLQAAMTKAKHWQVDEQLLQVAQQQMQQRRVLAAQQLAETAGDCCKLLLSDNAQNHVSQVLQTAQQGLAVISAAAGGHQSSMTLPALAAAGDSNVAIQLQGSLQQLWQQIELCATLGLQMNALLALTAVERACKDALHSGQSVVARVGVQLGEAAQSQQQSSGAAGRHDGCGTATGGALLAEESWLCMEACSTDQAYATDPTAADPQLEPCTATVTEHQQQHLPSLGAAVGHAGMCCADAVAACSRPVTAPLAAQVWLLQQQWAENLQAAEITHAAAANCVLNSSTQRAAVAVPTPGRKQACAAVPQQHLEQLQCVLCANAAVAVGQLHDLRQLDLSLEQLATLQGLGQLCPQLQVLAVNMNKLTELVGLQGCVELQQLAAKDNMLGHWPDITCHPQLQSLLLDNNKIRQLSVLSSSNNSGAGSRELHCQPLQQHISLQTLSLANNELTSLMLEAASASSPPPTAGDNSASSSVPTVVCALSSYLPNLQVLSIPGNQLSNLSGLEGCRSLRQLDISRNKLTNLQGLDGCHLLQQLHASGNGLSTFPRNLHLPLLQQLDMSSNRFSSWPTLPPLPHLQQLNLSDNQLSGPIPPLHGFLQLRVLDLGFNRLRDLRRCVAGIAAAQGLTELQLHDNAFQQGGLLSSGQSALQDQQWQQQQEGEDLSWYRQYVTAAMPWLQVLDRDPVYPVQQGRGPADAGVDSQSSSEVDQAEQQLLALGEYLSSRTDLTVKLMWHSRSGCSSGLGVPLQQVGTQMSSNSNSSSGTDVMRVCLTGAVSQCTVLSAVGAWVPRLLAEKAAHLAPQQQQQLPTVAQEQQQQLSNPLRRVLPCQHLQLAAGHMCHGQQHVQDSVNSSSHSQWLEEVDQQWCFNTRANLVWQQSQQQQQQQQLARGRDMPAQQHATSAAAGQSGQQHLVELTQQHCSMHQEQLQRHQLYYHQQQAVKAAAAEVLQCSWRARAVRLLFRQQLQHYRELQEQISSTVVLQSSWRCCCARKQLKLLQQQRQQQMAEGAEARNAAAARIQAAVRGHRVRGRLKAALAAAAGSSSSSSSSKGIVGHVGLGDSTDWDEFAGVPEDFVTMPAALLQELTQQQQQVIGFLRPDADPMGAAATAGSPLFKVLAAASSSRFDLSASSTTSAAPAVVNRGPTVAAAAADGSLHDSPSECTSIAAGGGSAGAAAAGRYEAKLQQVMTEWGFADRATAEAYYKRIKHTTKAAAKHKLQQKMQDPNVRLQRLQEQLQTASPVAAANNSKHGSSRRPVAKGAPGQVNSSRMLSGSSHSGSSSSSTRRGSSESAGTTGEGGGTAHWALPAGPRQQQQHQQQQGHSLEDDRMSVHSFSSHTTAADGSGSSHGRDHYTAGPPPAAGSLAHSSSSNSSSSSRKLQGSLSCSAAATKQTAALPGVAAGVHSNGSSRGSNSAGISSSSSVKQLQLPVLAPGVCHGSAAGAAAAGGLTGTEQQQYRHLPQLRRA